ncbi:MAG: outer membrane beta-barrel protein [Alphaproteobacteria bacterium]|nr:outer membrane beta-barrel protein [Alphaproteobacteria bacterium]
MNIVSKSLLSFGMAAAVAVSASADEKYFHGPYVGADIGLSDGGKFYYGGHAGFRHQTDSNVVFGIEGSFGSYAVSESQGSITAKIDHNWSVMGHLGYAFGESGKNLFKIGGGYNEVQASASGFGSSVTASVGDFRGFIGYERAISEKVNFRIAADFLKFDESTGGQATAGFSFRF